MKKIVVFLLVSFVVFSCGSKKKSVTKRDKRTPKTEQGIVNPKTATQPKKVMTIPDVPENSNLNAVEIYILKYNAIAMDEMRTSKIPASITLAQGILESGSGKGRLSVEANNHFGIKCHGWIGEKIYHDDDRSQECFRKYDYAHSSFKDHSEFLTGRGRYAQLFKLKPDDYKGWANGLRAAGYATDRKYPEKLISLIERYNLDKYDIIILGNKSAVKDMSFNHIVIKGDTLYSLSKKYNTTVDELKRLNSLNSNEISLGQFLIIKPN
ncbi:LysM peptidoglycan-binding domain-containing protein [Psychroserpens burtonensis]|uniref:Peptidoglycan hydrolase n=1 Tax=Psychroserpens burtonensis TaxID=49278 RepID=A0A5C7BBC9_9FLAO|nr:glucosaminidase domain-containing protein [Psychroserpens burtonensis]TXE17585.1 LysM peptidoglycan-binding domain-containing protein [Psychroserpens burtonensis]